MNRPDLPPNGTDEDALVYAVWRYALGGISIGKAAELADIDRWTMLNVLESAGITPRLGPSIAMTLRHASSSAGC